MFLPGSAAVPTADRVTGSTRCQFSCASISAPLARRQRAAWQMRSSRRTGLSISQCATVASSPLLFLLIAAVAELLRSRRARPNRRSR